MRDVLDAINAVLLVLVVVFVFLFALRTQSQLDGLDTFSQLTRPYMRELHAEQDAELAELRGRVAHLEKVAPLGKPPVGSDRP